MWLFNLLLKKETLDGDLLSTSLPLIFYIGFVSLSIFASPDKTLSFFEIFLLLQLLLLNVLIVNTVKTREEILFIFTILMLTVILESLIIIALRFYGTTIIIAGIMARVDPGPRVAGTVGSPINAAAFYWATLAPAFGMLFTPISGRYKLLAGLALALGTIALVFTLSRGGWIAFGLSMLFLGFAAWSRGWLSISVIMIALILLLLLVVVLYGLIADRLTSDDNGSAEARAPLMRLAFRIIADHPILGAGANNLPLIISDYATPELGDVWLYTVHNRYLLIWAETGFLSLLAFLWFLIATIRRGWQCWKFNDRFLSPLGFGIAAALMGGMVHMFVDVFRSRPDIQMLWLSAGLIVVMNRMGGKR
jgi:O-antigen ligase